MNEYESNEVDLVQEQLERAADEIRKVDGQTRELQTKRRELCSVIEKASAQLEERINRARNLARGEESATAERW